MEERGVGLISWQMKSIGILWIVFVAAVNSCPDKDNTTMDCDILPVDGLTCTYVKGNPSPAIDSRDVPSPVRNLSVATGFASRNGKCETRLNVTWTVSYDGSLQYLRGFFLVITFPYAVDGRTIFLNRTFNVITSEWTKNLSHTLFRHECVIPQSKTLYDIALYTLPMNFQSQPLTKQHHTASRLSSDNQCERTGDPNYTYNWTATMWTSENPLNASIEVCFYTAPPSFNFSAYLIFLLPNEGNALNTPKDEKLVYVDLFKREPVCEKFLNICPGVYKIWVRPDDNPVGTCHNGEERTSCTSTEVESINMTTSVCTSTVATTTSTTASTTTSTSTSTMITTSPSTAEASSEALGLSSSKIAGIVIGVVLAIIVIVGLVVGIYLCRRRSRHEKSRSFFIGGIPPGDFRSKPNGVPSYPIDDKQIVLLVYSSDNEYHRKVVRTFAAFLHSCCKCDVRFDDWSQVDISQTNALDWLTKQLHQVKHIIFINSLGAFMQHKAWIEGVSCIPVKELLLPDMFIPALRQIQARVYEKHAPTKRLQYYHVYFPYTDAKHLLDVSFGQRYRLMKHIEDLFLNIHGMTKYSGTGLTSACQINAKGYTGSVEGQALQSAIEEACANVHRNPNWFDECYTYIALNTEREVMPVKYRPGNPGDGHRASDCQPLTVQTSIESDSNSRPASFNSGTDSNNATTKSSDDGVHFDQELVPPSTSGSFSSDMEQRSVSIDVGYGDAFENSSTFDPNSPTVHLGFCPPIPDDDDEETNSIGSHMFFDKLNEMNEQYDSGLPFSSFELKQSDRSSC